ncbi:hypothetical protein [Paenibacillus sp. 1P07SE]|uniref:hypothetical protein n=1 Tax=Paenibacillus sp. 1P07SE TaxID=3132209 RepID=UPI0039A70E9F
MNIIEFLTQNLFFVIIIIGFLISLFSKSNQRKQGGSNNRMPDFGSGNREERRVPPGQRPTPDWQQSEQRAPQPEQPSYSETPVAQEIPLAEETARRIEEDARQREQEKEERRRAEQQRRAREEQRRRMEEERVQEDHASGDRTGVAVASGPARPGETLPGANELTSAVLWAEILGPPRAKRPFR